VTANLATFPLIALLAVAGVSMARSVALLVRVITRGSGSTRERATT
jgi:hypothetical protein